MLEDNLVNHLRPVQPNPEFIVKLGDRLLGRKNIQIENNKFRFAFLLLSLGLFLGVFLVWLLRRNRS
jgi:hypothetical protein